MTITLHPGVISKSARQPGHRMEEWRRITRLPSPARRSAWWSGGRSPACPPWSAIAAPAPGPDRSLVNITVISLTSARGGSLLAWRIARLLAIGVMLAFGLLPVTAPPSQAATTPAFSTNVTAASNADGRIELFAPGLSGTIWHSWQVTPNGAWSAWWPMYGTVAADKARPSVARNSDGRLEAFSAGSDGQLYHAWQLSAGGGWSGSASLGGGLGFVRTEAAANPDGRLEVFAVAPDHTLRHIWQLTAGGGWSGWASLGGDLDNSNVATGHNQGGPLEAFAVTNGGASTTATGPAGSCSGANPQPPQNPGNAADHATGLPE